MEIARHYEISRETVLRMFEAHNVPCIQRREFQRQAHDKLFDQALTMRTAGKSLKEIAATLRTHPRRIKRILLETTIPYGCQLTDRQSLHED